MISELTGSRVALKFRSIRETLNSPKSKGDIKPSVAMEILDTNRTNVFPQNLSFETEVVCRVGNLRFITHPVEKNPDGTFKYTIERRGTEIPTVVEVTKDPAYPNDRAFYKIVCFRGETKKDGKVEWVHLTGIEAEPYAREFLSTMKQIVKDDRELFKYLIRLTLL